MAGGFTERQGPEPAASSNHTPLNVIDPRTLAGVPVQPRVWIVENWLPSRHVTLSYGDGGVAITLLAHQLMTACATGTQWLGLEVMHCPVFGIFCEDHEEEVHRRQNDINSAMGLDYPRLGNMRWACAVGADNALVHFDPGGNFTLTRRFTELAKAAKEFGARLLVIDTAADTFDGNENDRRQVRTYLGTVLTQLAMEIDGAVLVNAHPSRSGMSARGDMDGGSTAWSNTARSRWALVIRSNEDGNIADESLRVLSRRKSNYARTGEEIELRWAGGVLVPAWATIVSNASRMLDVQAKFLRLLGSCLKQNVNVSCSRNASNFAPRTFSKRFDCGGYTHLDFEEAMYSLFASNRIINARYGRVGDFRFRIEQAQGEKPSFLSGPASSEIQERQQAFGKTVSPRPAS